MQTKKDQLCQAQTKKDQPCSRNIFREKSNEFCFQHLQCPICFCQGGKEKFEEKFFQFPCNEKHFVCFDCRRQMPIQTEDEFVVDIKLNCPLCRSSAFDLLFLFELKSFFFKVCSQYTTENGEDEGVPMDVIFQYLQLFLPASRNYNIISMNLRPKEDITIEEYPFGKFAETLHVQNITDMFPSFIPREKPQADKIISILNILYPKSFLFEIVGITISIDTPSIPAASEMLPYREPVNRRLRF